VQTDDGQVPNLNLAMLGHMVQILQMLEHHHIAAFPAEHVPLPPFDCPRRAAIATNPKLYCCHRQAYFGLSGMVIWLVLVAQFGPSDGGCAKQGCLRCPNVAPLLALMHSSRYGLVSMAVSRPGPD